jgi:hypothetical protein
VQAQDTSGGVWPAVFWVTITLLTNWLMVNLTIAVLYHEFTLGALAANRAKAAARGAAATARAAALWHISTTAKRAAEKRAGRPGSASAARVGPSPGASSRALLSPGVGGGGSTASGADAAGWTPGRTPAAVARGGPPPLASPSGVASPGDDVRHLQWGRDAPGSDRAILTPPGSGAVTPAASNPVSQAMAVTPAAAGHHHPVTAGPLSPAVRRRSGAGALAADRYLALPSPGEAGTAAAAGGALIVAPGSGAGFVAPAAVESKELVAMAALPQVAAAAGPLPPPATAGPAAPEAPPPLHAPESAPELSALGPVKRLSAYCPPGLVAALAPRWSPDSPTKRGPALAPLASRPVLVQPKQPLAPAVVDPQEHAVAVTPVASASRSGGRVPPQQQQPFTDATALAATPGGASAVSGGSGGSSGGGASLAASTATTQLDGSLVVTPGALGEAGAARARPLHTYCGRRIGCLVRPTDAAFRLVHASATQRFVVFCIIANVVVLSLDKYPVWDAGTANTIEVLNFAFTMVFAAEMLLKAASLGLRAYARDPFNDFDAFIVLISVADLALAPPAAFTPANDAPSGGSGASALRALRLFRVFKLVRNWTSLRLLLGTIGRTVKDLANFTVLLVLTIYIFSLVVRRRRRRLRAPACGFEQCRKYVCL